MNNVTQPQLDALQTNIKTRAFAQSEKLDRRAFVETGTAGAYWLCRTAFISKHQTKPMARDYKPAAVINTETGEFVKASITKAGLRLTKSQPKNPPTIDAYELNNCGDVVGTHPKRTFITLVSSGFSLGGVTYRGERFTQAEIDAASREGETESDTLNRLVDQRRAQA